MRRRLILTILAGLALAIVLPILPATRLAWGAASPGKAAPPARVPPPATNALSEILNGKSYPQTMKSEDIDATYHVLVLIDAQGKPNAYVTKGETLGAGGESFLVAYLVTFVSDAPGPVQPKPGTEAQLTLINMRYVEAMGGIRTILPAPKPSDTVPSGGTK